MRLIFDDGEILEGSFTLCAIGNGKYCGGGYKSLPDAILNDGEFDICAINKIKRSTFLGLVKSYKNGTYTENEKAKDFINLRKTSHFRMEFSEPAPICIDGEIKGAKTIEFTLIKNAFKFVIPKGADYLHMEKQLTKV